MAGDRTLECSGGVIDETGQCMKNGSPHFFFSDETARDFQACYSYQWLVPMTPMYPKA